MKVYIVMEDDCRENECGCWSESIRSVWMDERLAKADASMGYNCRVVDYDIQHGTTEPSEGEEE